MNRDKSMPLVSVVIPTFNTPPNIINSTISSVINQSYKNIEIIIVDDCSTNQHTKETIRLWQNKFPQIQAIFLNRNYGVAKATNIGAQHAKGSFIAFIDHDDIWHWRKLEVTIQEMENNNLNLILHLSWAFDGSTKKLLNPLPFPFLTTNKASFEDILLRNLRFTSNSQLVVRAQFFKELHGFKEDLRITGDRDFVLRASSRLDKLHIIPKPLTFYRIHQHNLHKEKVLLAIMEDLSISSRHFINLINATDKPVELFTRFIQRSFFIYAEKIPWLQPRISFFMASLLIAPLSFVKNELVLRIKWRASPPSVWTSANKPEIIEKEFAATLKKIADTLDRFNIHPREKF